MSELVKTNGHSLAEMSEMALAVVSSGLFPSIKTPDAAMTLMLLCQSEGLHPMQALRRYDIIQGRPALKTDAMLAEFQKRGGKVDWIRLDDECAEAEFHASGLVNPVRIKFDTADAKRAGLLGKDNWNKYPRAMRRARVVSEGVRTADPGVNAGVYTPEEVSDFDDSPKVEWPKALTKVEVEEKKALGLLKGQRSFHQPIPAHVLEETPPPVDDEPPAIFGEPDEKAAPAWAEHKRVMTAEIDRGDFQAKLEAIPAQIAEKIAKDSQSMFDKGNCEHPGCAAPLVTATSESNENKGRQYLSCQWALAERHRLRRKGITPENANKATAGHTRKWLPKEKAAPTS
jgi:hypothetical protein